MENIYLLMIVALVALSIVNLVVGVSNDAVNFLNSAIGSKAISVRTILIIASLGIFIGASFSSGMMEVARSGIFHPSKFHFDEVMIIFMAVMITNILLLDFFNTIGLPTSTTISIVFGLLGAAVIMALIKIGNSDTEGFSSLISYINADKVPEIILWIILSVVIAFSAGIIVQYLSRLLFTFQSEKQMKYFGAMFGGVALTSISYFIFIKGLKGTPFQGTFESLLETNIWILLSVGFIFWTIFSQLFILIFKKNILIIVIAAGTFGLALAFAGNDLVNFIGVPMAAYHSYADWSVSGADPSQYLMLSLNEAVPAEPLLLFGAGIIMVLTLWFSKKSRGVSETEINLGRQGEGKEKFEPNMLSRILVKTTTQIAAYVNYLLPDALGKKIDKRFEKPVIVLPRDKTYELPAFDLIRASINLMVAGILISIATSKQLPLSTTYVTFMVAMGTSLADRAWGRESAVYRVAGVLKVIGGWFFTAFVAFAASGVLTYLIYIGRGAMIGVLLLLAILLLVRNYISHKNKTKIKLDKSGLKKTESKTVQGIIRESAENISNVVSRSNKIYTDMLRGLAKQDTKKLKKSKKGVKKLNDEVEELRDNIFYFIKNLDETSVRGSNFYIIILGYLTDVVQSLEFISKASYKHVNNNHKALRFNQIKDLQEIDRLLEELLNEIEDIFHKKEFQRIGRILANKDEIFNSLSQKIEKQVARTRTEESSPKNTTLYFSLLLETKDLVTALMNLMQEYYSSYKKT
ncbi:inorganic phosphate transporter [Aequorivita sp. H23M31]|uniref:Phosphate transporter n=1 Tax=Aequorivita ciconiae TaxID=2494375 RepID=A0A410G4P7_9FLAO|nr:inorganic phosphate transporter [Aequorivita sp. H23M31]QAA82240.1 inorganic phosphate transporter [Aequorivita sp. H23M31]